MNLREFIEALEAAEVIAGSDAKVLGPGGFGLKRVTRAGVNLGRVCWTYGRGWVHVDFYCDSDPEPKQ